LRARKEFFSVAFAAYFLFGSFLDPLAGNGLQGPAGSCCWVVGNWAATTNPTSARTTLTAGHGGRHRRRHCKKTSKFYLALTFCINSTQGRGGHESPCWLTDNDLYWYTIL
jgi:hypothetical protein